MLSLKVKQAMLAMQRRPWEQGIAMQAMLEIGDIATVVLMAKDAVNLQASDGRLALPEDAPVVTDPAAAGEGLLLAAKFTADPALYAAAQRMIAYLLHTAPRTEDGIYRHLTTVPQLWSDSLYMAPPFLAIAGYADEALLQLQGLRAALWNSDAQLFAHIYDTEQRRLVRPEFWGVGNGWAAAGMLRVALALPDTHEVQRVALIDQIRELIVGCLRWQRDDGLFTNIVDSPDTFVETNLAQMLAFTIYRGVTAHYFSPELLPFADRMRVAARQQVDEFGLVQGVCGAPTFDHPGVAVEGQAFFLMMEAAHAV